MIAISSRAQRHQRRHRKNRVQIDSLNEIGRLNMVFFTGAGLSAESGVSTFRGENGLWYQNDNIGHSQVSNLETNLAECLAFHSQRRRVMLSAFPSQAHYLIAELQQRYHVRIITQNIDDCTRELVVIPLFICTALFSF